MPTEQGKSLLITSEQLIAAGFVETHYPGQEGVFYTKRMAAWDMPYTRENIVDNDSVMPEDEVVVEVTPGRGIQMSISSADYVEESVPLDTPEGLGLLRDAGLIIEGNSHVPLCRGSRRE